jgi:hypothetical protein
VGTDSSALSLQFALFYAEGHKIKAYLLSMSQSEQLAVEHALFEIVPWTENLQADFISEFSLAPPARERFGAIVENLVPVKFPPNIFLDVCRLCRRSTRRRCRVRQAHSGLVRHTLQRSMRSRNGPRRRKHDHLRANFYPLIKVGDILVG